MDWEKCMNRAMDYIEENLDSSIDYLTAAQFVNCSEWEFRRIFSFLAQIPLSEYIRRRRLTTAVTNLQRGEKIIDIAQIYGYESQAAFSRAFRRLHGFAPSFARDKAAMPPKAFPRLTFRLVLMEDMRMDKSTGYRPSIIGSGDVGGAVSVEPDAGAIHAVNSSFWSTNGNDVLGAIHLPNYGAFITEEKYGLMSDVSGKKILEIGCGSGQSLKYLGERGAAELWGVDISAQQITRTEQLLAKHGLSAKLRCAPMEDDCGLPKDYFDYVCAVYSIGWTTDLDGTLCKIASYLKKGGSFIFSWSHPIHKCVAAENEALVFKKCYFDESWYSVSVGGAALSLSDRKLSTYINALAKAGFVIEEMVEESDSDMLAQSSSSSFAKKAAMLPVTFVIKAKKL